VPRTSTSPSDRSAGILLFRRRSGRLEVLLVHPGGPIWASKDLGAWSVPKGLCEEGEDLLDAAKREFEEETGGRAEGTFVPLTAVRQPSGKIVHAFALRGEFDPRTLRSNTFTMEWPPRSGMRTSFPEVDGCAWMPIAVAKRKILAGQVPLIDELVRKLARRGPRAKRGKPGAD